MADVLEELDEKKRKWTDAINSSFAQDKVVENCLAYYLIKYVAPRSAKDLNNSDVKDILKSKKLVDKVFYLRTGWIRKRAIRWKSLLICTGEGALLSEVYWNCFANFDFHSVLQTWVGNFLKKFVDAFVFTKFWAKAVFGCWNPHVKMNHIS